MTDKEKIEEITRVVNNIIQSTGYNEHLDGYAYGCLGDDVSEELYNAGYHKTIWHKVADGDLPEYAGLYLVVCGDESLPEYDVDFYENHKDGKRWVHNEGRVIVWTELPTYKD